VVNTAAAADSGISRGGPAAAPPGLAHQEATLNRDRRIRRSLATPGVMHQPGHAAGGRATRAAPVVFADLVHKW